MFTQTVFICSAVQAQRKLGMLILLEGSVLHLAVRENTICKGKNREKESTPKKDFPSPGLFELALKKF